MRGWILSLDKTLSLRRIGQGRRCPTLGWWRRSSQTRSSSSRAEPRGCRRVRCVASQSSRRRARIRSPPQGLGGHLAEPEHDEHGQDRANEQSARQHGYGFFSIALSSFIIVSSFFIIVLSSLFIIVSSPFSLILSPFSISSFFMPSFFIMSLWARAPATTPASPKDMPSATTTTARGNQPVNLCRPASWKEWSFRISAPIVRAVSPWVVTTVSNLGDLPRAHLGVTRGPTSIVTTQGYVQGGRLIRRIVPNDPASAAADREAPAVPEDLQRRMLAPCALTARAARRSESSRAARSALTISA